MRPLYPYLEHADNSWIGEQMKIAHNFLEQERKVVPIRHGLATSYEDNGDWLSPMSVRDHFISRNKKSWSPKADEFTILGNEKGLTLLREDKRTGEQDLSEWYWVVNIDFCNENRLLILL